jgi:DinB superfamily
MPADPTATPPPVSPPISPKEIATLLRASMECIRAEAGALSGPAASWHPRPGEWCAKEVIGHLIEAERRGFAGRVRQFVEADNPACVPWDQDAVARARGDCGRPLAGLVEELTALRADSARLVEGLPASALGRGGQHPKVGTLTVSDILHEWVHHDRNHLKQMMANVQALAWPHMGNAQRFSAS